MKNTNPPSTLSLPAKLNIICDKIATTERIKMQMPYQLDTTIPQTRATIFIQNNQLTENMRDCIRHQLYDTKLQKYLKDKYAWSEEKKQY